MRYAAKHFVKIAGCMYTPGEIVDNPIPEDKLQRLLRLGAVEQLDTSGAEFSAWQDVSTSEETDAHDESPNDPAPEEAPDAEEDEAEAPEIDAMVGVVTAESQKPPAKTVRPKKTSGGRKKV